MEAASQPGGRAGSNAVLALALALAALVLLMLSFRGLLFLTLPLATAAVVFGILGGRRAGPRPTYAAAMVAVVVGGVALMLSLLALGANILISRDYEVYEGGAEPPAVSDRP